MAKIVETYKDGFKFQWSNSPKSREISCDGFVGEVKVLEWAFPRLFGVSVAGNAIALQGQAAIYARTGAIKDFCQEKLKGEIQFEHPERGMGRMSSPLVVWFSDPETPEGDGVCIVFASIDNLLKSDWKFVRYIP